MAGYREHSFDPFAYEQAGAPMRPYNWVQWTGIAIGTIGILINVVYVAGSLGWMPKLIGSSSLGLPAIVLGIVLINSRREPSTQAGSEQLAKNRRVLLITTAIVVAILGAATVIDLLGAK